MGGHRTVLLLAWLAMQVIAIFGDNDTLPPLTEETDQKNMGEELENGDKLRQLCAKFGAETDLKDQAWDIKNQGKMIQQQGQELKALGDYLKVQGQVVEKIATDLKELKGLVGVIEDLGTSFRDLRKGIVHELDNQDKNLISLNDKMDVLKYQLCQHMRGSNQCDVTDPRRIDDGQGPITDCSQAVRSGEYTITAGNSNFDAYCQVDGSAKWTVIQRRTNGRVSFARNWAAYREGFGDVAGEFWLGNEYIHKLTAAGLTRLRVDLEDWDKTKHTVVYNAFKVAGEGNKYKMTVSGFTGSKPPGDALKYHTGMMFTTTDRDNDRWANSNCASVYGGGGWWWNRCHNSNLNGGAYNATGTSTGINWGSWRAYASLKASSMMLSKP